MMANNTFSQSIARAISSITMRYLKWLPDKIYLSILFRAKLGKWINWKNPQTFNEKLQWLKLYNRNPKYTTMVDKYAVKDYVASIIGNEYIIPKLGVWNTPEEIDFDALPDKFVLKTTHGGGGGGVVICRDKATFDIEAARRKLNCSMKSDIYKIYREWPYKKVPRRIIAEKFIEFPDKTDLTDYKIYCFDGEPKYIQVIQDRHTKETIDFFDTDWNHLEFFGLNPIARPANQPIPKPANLEDMLRIAKKLSHDTKFIRVDLYHTGEDVYFGELTFYPASGLGTFTPTDYNHILGKMIELESDKAITGGGKYLINSDSNFITTISDSIEDYKFFCFNGEPKVMLVSHDRFHGVTCFDYYDMNFHHLPFEQGGPNAKVETSKPKNFDLMKQIASQLSYGIPHVRVDLYNCDGKIYFGELTFFDSSGFAEFNPPEWDYNFGQWIFLPSKQI